MYKVYIGKFTKNGLKEKARRIFYFIFYKVSKKVFRPYFMVLNQVYFYFSPAINTAFIRKSGRLIFIPRKIFYKQSVSRSVQWLIKSRDEQISFKMSFINNILNIFNKKGFIYNKKIEYYKKILANRIFMKRSFKKVKFGIVRRAYFGGRIRRRK